MILSRSRIVCCSEPRGIACEVGLSVIEKSEEAEFTVTPTVVDLDKLPLVPLTEAEYEPAVVEP